MNNSASMHSISNQYPFTLFDSVAFDYARRFACLVHTYTFIAVTSENMFHTVAPSLCCLQKVVCEATRCILMKCAGMDVDRTVKS